jgi:hypothetical protein
VADAKQFFQDAVSRDLLVKNPFAALKGTVGSNRERDYFIDRVAATKVLDACPDNEWRLLFALSRFGGLRCPSEHLLLTWADVNWSENRMVVRSTKTEHHQGKGTRAIPIFPELRPYLEAAWDTAKPGAIYEIGRYRGANANLRTQLQRIIAKAGLAPWPKLFQNLRASRATELASEHPAHVAAAWLGHSTVVASKHYWQVTDADFDKAVRAQSEAAQNPAQQAHAESRGDSQAATPAHEKAPVIRAFATLGETLQYRGMGDTGLEPVTPSLSKDPKASLKSAFLPRITDILASREQVASLRELLLGTPCILGIADRQNGRANGDFLNDRRIAIRGFPANSLAL